MAVKKEHWRVFWMTLLVSAPLTWVGAGVFYRAEIETLRDRISVLHDHVSVLNDHLRFVQQNGAARSSGGSSRCE
ncbi:hypothetical protein MPC4_110096 [Methylocella tundrae]|uniref:Uncharacterized protein n=1 Tax=Methylocella tundrae TaxID=227605 RepID=A0A8B6M1S3_METTU|nr:hypothetical protein MPC1_7310004 [Methylocella tundrae]VTZ48796.1 hypothetical protein MPC4_110096 [Methylocella tundrae]